MRCFDASKDVNIPTPNIHFPRTPYAPPLSMRKSVLRPLLLFYAGWNYKVRLTTAVRGLVESCSKSFMLRAVC